MQNLNVYATWVADYAPETHEGADVHVVKLHTYETLTFPYDIIVTTYRDAVERVASLIRMGWLSKEPEEIKASVKWQSELHDFWSTRSDLEINYDSIVYTPECALDAIAKIFEMRMSEQALQMIAHTLDNMKGPQKVEGKYGHDSETLFHPRHRGSEKERGELVSFVRRIIQEF